MAQANKFKFDNVNPASAGTSGAGLTSTLVKEITTNGLTAKEAFKLVNKSDYVTSGQGKAIRKSIRDYLGAQVAKGKIRIDVKVRENFDLKDDKGHNTTKYFLIEPEDLSAFENAANSAGLEYTIIRKS